jgi:hypothetical protein
MELTLEEWSMLDTLADEVLAKWETQSKLAGKEVVSSDMLHNLITQAMFKIIESERNKQQKAGV